MTFFNMTLFHIKRIVKTPGLLINLVFMPIGTIIFFSFVFFPKNEENTGDGVIRTVILLGEGNADIKKALIEEDYKDNIQEDRHRVFQDLEKGNVGVIYEIPDHYIERLVSGKKVNIKATNRTKKTRSPLFEYDIQHLTREILLKKAVSTNLSSATDFNYHQNIKITNLKKAQSVLSPAMVLSGMTLFYIYISCLGIASDLVTFKKNNSLRRAVLSPNSSVSLMGSHLAAATIFLVVSNISILGYIHSQSPLTGEMFLRASLTILLSILLGLSFSLVMFRIFKEPGVVSNLGTLFLMLMVGITFLEGLKLNPMLTNLSYISPFKWLFDILEKGVNPASVTILLLTVVVLLTAGSYKLENYVQR